jgi:hypothetical protein
MKQRFLLFLMFAGIAFNSIIAQSSQLTVFHQEGEKFWVIIDGIKQNDQPLASVFLPDIKQDFLRIKIIFENENIADIDKNIQTKDVDGNFTHSKYVIRTDKKNKTTMRFHSYEVLQGSASVQPVPVENKPDPVTVRPDDRNPGETITVGTYVTDPETGKPIGMDVTVTMPAETDVVAADSRVNYSGFVPNGTMCPVASLSTKAYLDFKYDIDAQNSFQREEYIKSVVSKNCMLAEQVAGIIQLNYPTVDEVEIAKFAYRYTIDTQNYGVVLNAIRSEYKRNEVLKFLNIGTYPVTTTPVNPTEPVVEQPGHYEMPGYSGRIGCPWPMSEQDFIGAKNSISSRSFEDTKLTVAKRIASSRCMFCSQVKEIMDLFSFEASKLEFAKYAYDFVFDIDNFYVVNDAFTFSSSIDELDNYISKKQR